MFAAISCKDREQNHKSTFWNFFKVKKIKKNKKKNLQSVFENNA